MRAEKTIRQSDRIFGRLMMMPAGPADRAAQALHIGQSSTFSGSDVAVAVAGSGAAACSTPLLSGLSVWASPGIYSRAGCTCVGIAYGMAGAMNRAACALSLG
jgi:hypothetical protein